MNLEPRTMKSHLLLLNKLHRAEFKKELVPTPSRLTDDEITQYFTRLFIKRDNYYVPKSQVSLKIDEEPFKKIKLKFIYTRAEIAENARVKAIADKAKREEKAKVRKEQAMMKKSEEQVKMETMQKELSNRLIKDKIEKLKKLITVYELDKTNMKNKQKMVDEFLKYATKSKSFLDEVKKSKRYELYFREPYEAYLKRKEKLRTEEEALKTQIKQEARASKKKPELMG